MIPEVPNRPRLLPRSGACPLRVRRGQGTAERSNGVLR